MAAIPMLDQHGREIEYLRISVTDRCNLRCRYCMPEEGIPLTAREQLLDYEEFLRVASAAVELGIVHFKVTGGEPLLRRGCTAFIRRLKALPGVERVTLTTNGLLLAAALDELLAAGLDGVNISLDTLDRRQFQWLTRTDAPLERVLEAVRLCAGRLPTKVNAVLLEETEGQILPLAALAQQLPVDVRFIQRMPIGGGAVGPSGRVLEQLRKVWPDLGPTEEKRGCGPARYYMSGMLKGRIGLIEAVSEPFCAGCNRVRLTSTGVLKPCLCYEEGTDLRPLLRSGAADKELRDAMAEAVFRKPRAHCFASGASGESRSMGQIGG